MLQKTRKRIKYFFFLFYLVIFFILLPFVNALTIVSEETIEGTNIKLLDVSIGETEEESACIFEINGKTVVVNRREKETYDGVTIWVKEVYAVNTKDKASDRCEFIYSLTEAYEDTYEDPVKKETIGTDVVYFLLGTRTEITNTEEIKQLKTEDEISVDTRVLVNGYDVTEKEEDVKGDGVNVEKAKKGIISSFFSWLFG